MYGQGGTNGLDSWSVAAINSTGALADVGYAVCVTPTESDWAVVTGDQIGTLSFELGRLGGAADEAPLCGVVTKAGADGKWIEVKLVGIAEGKFNTSKTGGSAVAAVGAPLTWSNNLAGTFEAAASGQPVIAYALETIAQEDPSTGSEFTVATAPTIRVLMVAPGIHCDMQ